MIICDVIPQVTQSPEIAENDNTSTIQRNTLNKTIKKVRNVSHKRKNRTESNDQLKKQYYQKKLECAIVEKKTRIIEYKMALQKQKLLNLEIKMKEKQYESFLNKS